MKNFLLVILSLLLILFVVRECNKQPPPPVVVVRSDTIYDTIYDSVPVIKFVPLPVPFEVFIFDSIPLAVDTQLIINSYFSHVVYNRVLFDDSSAFISLIDTVFQNRLLSGSLTFVNRRPVQLYTIVNQSVSLPSHQLYVGALLCGSQSSFGAGGSLFDKSRRDHLYGVGYDFINKDFHVNFLWKVSFRRPRDAL